MLTGFMQLWLVLEAAVQVVLILVAQVALA
jgi:hypothetical protein